MSLQARSRPRNPPPLWRAAPPVLALMFALPAYGATLAEAPRLEAAGTQTGNYLSALVANEDHDVRAAASYFREALRADPRNLDLLERAFGAALANGALPEAQTLADRLLARDPVNSLGRLTSAVRAMSDGQFGAARAQLAAGEAGRSHDVTTTLLSAWTYAGGNDLRRALEAMDHIRDASIMVFRDFHAGLMADMLGNAAEAQKRLKSAYEGEKTTLRLADAYARFLARHNDVDGAKKVYQDFSKVAPRHPIVEAALADLNAGRPLEPLIKTAKEGAAEALYGLGGAGGREGDEIAALIYLRLALQLRPDHALAAINLGDLFNQLKQGDAAIAAYELVAPTSPMRKNADIQAALTLDELGRSEPALKRLGEIVAANPRDVDSLTAYAGLQRAAKKYEDAAATYGKALDAVGDPDRAHWALLYFRGICYERSKRWPKAEADFKKALELYPEQPLVLNYLGYSWVDQGVNLDDAFKMLRRAVDLKPDDGYIVDSLGWAHFKLGHFSEAMEQMEKAIQLKPADPTVNDHLGDVYWRVNRKNEAHFQWNHARDMKPEPEDLPAILKKIDAGLPEPPAANQTELTPGEPKKDGG